MASKNHPEFSSGRTVKARELQYIQRPADAELLDHCRNGRPAYILHSPQMGKSSLIAHTAEQLNANAHHAVLIDLSQFPLPPREDEWFHKIVRILDDSLDLSTDPITWWENQQEVPPPIRLTQLITKVILPELTSPLVLFIDEIERTAALPFRKHFFEWLARLYESRGTHSILYRLSFVVCGVATPSQLIPEDWPLLFQWSHRVALSDFTLPEALLLAEGLSLPTEAANETVQWIYRWTNGHPYLTQLLCQLLEGQHRTTWVEAEVDECIQHFISSPQGLREPNFQFVRTALTEPTPKGESLLEPYLDLLEGKTERLKTNHSALEQLRLVGVLREDDEHIIIRNLLYQEVFPPVWAKRHLGSPAALAPSPEPPFTPAPDPTPQPVAVPMAPPPAPQHSYVMAASLFLVGVGLLIWFFRGPVSTPLSLPAQEVSTAAIETSTPSSGNGTVAEMAQQAEALIQAQEKIQDLETTIATYQRLSNEELENVQTQRTLLESQLLAQESTFSDLRVEVTQLKEDLENEQETTQQAQLDFESAHAKLDKALDSATAQRNTAIQEAKNLQTALLKQSSLSPGEIKELVADRNQLETKLTTINGQLTKTQQEARDLATALSQEKLKAKSEEKQFDKNRAQLQTQLNTLRADLKQTKASLKQTEQHAQGQQILAQQELTRLQKIRASVRDQLTEKQQVLSEQQKRLSNLEAESTKYRQDLQEALTASTTLQARLQASQQTETQLQKRVAQLETDFSQTQEMVEAKQSALQQERDHLSQELAKTLANFETTNNRLTTLSTQLTSAKQELANRQGAIRDIHTASSEKTQLAENQLTALVQARTDLESRLRQNEGALSQAQQRIAELEGHTEKTTDLVQALEARKKENQTLSVQLASTQQQFDNLQASLKRGASTITGNLGDQRASTSPTSQIQRILPLITTAITNPSTDSLAETTKLLWARQAFLFSLRSGGRESASIDHSLREGLHASPIQLKGVSGRIHSLTYDPSGDHVIAGTSEGKVLLWSLSQSTDSPQVLTGHTAGVGSVSVSPDGQWLASGSLDSTIRVWSLSQPSTQPRILQAHTKGVTSLAFRQDGKQLVSGSQDHRIRLWDLTKDQPQSAVLGKHDGRVNAIAYTPDGQSLLSGGDDLTLRVWDLQRTDSPPKILRGHQQSISTIAIHPSGWMVATGSRDRQIGLWNLRQSLASPTFLTGSTGRISQVRFNADGTSVASVGSDKSLRIWNWQDANQPPIQFPKHKGTLEAMAISPDGRTIAVGGSSQSVTLWGGTEQLAHAVCDTAKENLSFSEWKHIVGEKIPYERTCPNLPLHPSFLEEGKRLAKQGSRDQAQTIFERAKQLDPFLEIDPKKEADKLSAKS